MRRGYSDFRPELAADQHRQSPIESQRYGPRLSGQFDSLNAVCMRARRRCEAAFRVDEL